MKNNITYILTLSFEFSFASTKNIHEMIKNTYLAQEKFLS